MDYTAFMRGKMIAFAILQILLLQALPVISGEYCPYDYSGIFQSSRYCDGGCCGTKYSDYSDVCCDVVNVGVIAGSVVGGLVGLGVFIAIIVCCCCACARSGQRPGAVIQPMNTNSQTIVMNNSTSIAQGMSTNPGPPYGNVGYPYGVAPPGYVPYDNAPQERAYPPAYASKY